MYLQDKKLNSVLEEYFLDTMEIVTESSKDDIDKEIQGMNIIFRNKLKKNDKISYEIHKASKVEKAGYKFASGVLLNKEKAFGGIWVITLYGDNDKKIGKYYTCDFKYSNVDSDLKSKVKEKK